MADRPYTPATLAAEWGCSAHHVRNLIDNGELRAFRLGGKLLRIPAEAAREFEARMSTIGADVSKAPAASD
jgi:excisionase family DNA binding protein